MVPHSHTSSSLSFNQDQTCFSASTPTGFRVFSCDPFRHLFRRIFPGNGFSHVEMLFQSNTVSLVGNGSHPQFPPNKLILWDDYRGESFGSLSFRTAIRGVRLRRDRIVVALEFHIYVYNFKDLKLFRQVETYANPKGLCTVSQLADSMVLACPGLHKGEVRRGANAAEIYSLAFSSTAQWLAVSSDKGTVHVFCLKVNISNTEHEKSHSSSNSSVASITSFSSSLPFIKFKGSWFNCSRLNVEGMLPKYFNSEWSFAQFRLHEHCRYTVAFGNQKNTLTILGIDGSFYRCEFDPVHGGQMTQLESHNFLKLEVAS